MKILIVCSHRYYAPYTDYVAPFIYEQMQGLKALGCEFRICFVKGGGVKSYINAWKEIRKAIKEYQPNLIHAHYGLCCLLANLQRRVPVVSTYHGSDINDKGVRILSKIAINLSLKNIFVSKPLWEIAGCPKRSIVLPCGVDTSLFYHRNKQKARLLLGWKPDGKYVLFSKMFNDPVKNYPLAKAAVDHINGAELIEFVGYTREESALLYNASDAVIMTSLTEGSPQFIKEALACQVPIISVRVGDVPRLIEGVNNCYLCDYNVITLFQSLQIVLNGDKITNGNERIHCLGLDNNTIIEKLMEIYAEVVD